VLVSEELVSEVLLIVDVLDFVKLVIVLVLDAVEEVSVVVEV
jgi:hypothetical protein